MGTTTLQKWLGRIRKEASQSTPPPSSDCVISAVSAVELEESDDVLATSAIVRLDQHDLTSQLHLKPTRDLMNAPQETKKSRRHASKQKDPERESTHGLLPLHPPRPNSPENTLEGTFPIDIVAVHGVTGDAYTTWKHKDGFFWLRDSLPNEFPGARIYSYGYPADVLCSKGTGGFEEYARTLLEGLHRERRLIEDQRRPIVFICHSMGGIVVKEALNIADIDRDRYANIRNSVPAILFLAVPHRGSDSAVLFSMLAAMADASLKGTGLSRITGAARPDLIRALQKGSPGLKSIARNFRHRTADIKCYSFLEQDIIVPLKNRVVDDSSGSMDVANEVVIPMAGRDHRTICRFESDKSEAYRDVLGILQEVASEVTNKMSAELAIEDIPCLHSLYFPSMTDRLHETSSKAHPQTCFWIFTNPSYVAWTQAFQGLLWIKGHPGTGKSTLMAFIYRHFEKEPLQRKRMFLSFFFHGNGTSLQKSQLGMFRSLLHQLYKQSLTARRMILIAFKEKVNGAGEPGKDWVWQLDELQVLFQDILLSDSMIQNEVTIFVDALDEAMDNGVKVAQNLVGFFHRLNDAVRSKGGNTKVCISCRNYPVVSADAGLQIDIHNVNRSDIEIYVEYQLRTCVEGWRQQSEKERRELQSAIVEKAAGVFLWVYLRLPKIVRSLNDGTTSFDGVRRLLETESNELFPMYENILMNEIDSSLKKKALIFMQWVCLAERPLSLTEIRCAMASDECYMRPGQMSCADSSEFVESDLMMEKLTKSLSGGLAEVKHNENGSTVQLFHQSIHDFLRERGLETLSSLACNYRAPKMHSSEVLGRSHDRLSRSCIRYLGLGETSKIRFRMGVVLAQPLTEIETEFPFIRYAATFCFVHAEKAEDLGVSQHYLLELLGCSTQKPNLGLEEDDLEPIFEYSPNIFETWKILYDAVDRGRWRHPGLRSSAVHLAACFNLSSVIRLWAKEGGSIQIDNYEAVTPLHHAARLGYEELTVLLLELGADIEARTRDGSTPLGLAAANGQANIAKLLLHRGANINTRTAKFGSVLEAACNAKGSLELIKTLIDHGATVKGEKVSTSHALQEAAYTGDEDVVRLLLKHGADVNAKGPHGSALQATAQAPGLQTERLVTLLIEEGAEINTQGGAYGSALQAAAQRVGDPAQTERIVRLLLDNGANVNAQGGLYGNALQAAARHSSLAVIDLLLRSGANINARGGESGSALQAAVWNGEDTVQFLLSRGAEVNTQGGYYGSPLQCAAALGNSVTFRMLWEKGARADIKGGVHQNMIEAAGAGGNREIVSLLLERGADINEKGGERGGALQAAVPFNATRFVQFLLDNGADVNLQGGEHGSSLCAAVRWPRESMVKLLLTRGADIHARASGDSHSAFELVALRGDVKIMKLFLQNGNDINPQDERFAKVLRIAQDPSTKQVADLLLEKARAAGSSYASSVAAL